MMGSFRDEEKRRQAEFKATSSYFSEPARRDALFRGRGIARPYCLPPECATENLFDEIRASALTYFEQFEIKWHGGRHRQPTNHLCSSQICCVNFLFPFADKPQALAELLRPLFPDIRTMLPIEANGQYVSFEYIGAENYLREKMAPQ